MPGVVSGFCIGQRLHVDTTKATVKYVGAVDGQTGTWIGLEWDDPSRGKHDGCHGGKRYFTTTDGRKSGSFVRQEKLQVSAEAGVTLLQALQQKYDPGKADSLGTNDMLLSAKVKVQLVGTEKLQRQRGGIDKLREVTLLDVGISSVGVEGELARSASSIQDLDVSRNLLSGWEEVEQLCRELPALHTLNLSHNLLRPLPRPQQQILNLRRLVLNSCRVSFSKAMELLRGLPELQELHLGENGISQLDFDPELSRQLTSLKVLGLETNRIQQWTEVGKLRALPALQRLLLSGNQIASIKPSSPGESGGFPALASLILAGNALTDWASVDALHSFPQLTNLRLSGNPHPGDAAPGRYQVIARIGNLQSLNGSIISSKERSDCELQYLREISGQSGLKDQGFQHPRLSELRTEYGDVGATVADEKTKTLGDTMLSVELRCSSTCSHTCTVSKRLPGTLSILKLKALCERFFGIPAGKQVLVLDQGMAEDITKFESRDLYFFAAEKSLRIEVREASAS